MTLSFFFYLIVTFVIQKIVSFMKVVILKYNAGNVFSVHSALRRLGVEAIVSADPEILRSADKVIIPGVGQAQAAMVHLRTVGLDKLIVDLKQPVLGICLGMQVMCAYSEEGSADCLGVFPVTVKRFESTDDTYKIPHMGWNMLTELKEPLFRNVQDKDYVYFVHSYYVELCSATIATCNYIWPFSAALNKDNFYACQFHPEKSGDVGEQVLRNFIAI